MRERRWGWSCLVLFVGITVAAGALMIGGLLLFVSSFDVCACMSRSVSEPRVRVLDAATGQEKWQRNFGHDATLVGVADGLVVVADGRGQVHAAGARNGRDRWVRPLDSAVIADNLVIGIKAHRAVAAYDLVSGAPRWQATRLSVFPDKVLAPGGDTVVVYDPQSLSGLDARTGTQRWTVPRTGYVWASLDSRVLLVTDFQQAHTSGAFQVTALDAESGTLAWVTPFPSAPTLGGPMGHPIDAGPSIGLPLSPTNGDRYTSVFVDPATGTERWRAPHDLTAAVFAYDPEYAGGTLFETNFDTISVAARDPLTGAIRWQLPSSLGDLFAHSGTLYLTGLDSIQAINESDTTTRWTTRINGSGGRRPVGVTRGFLVLASP